MQDLALGSLWASWALLATRKLALSAQKMADLVAMRQVLSGLAQQCDVGVGGVDCPIIDALAGV